MVLNAKTSVFREVTPVGIYRLSEGSSLPLLEEYVM
jgi:hypothetical protein